MRITRNIATLTDLLEFPFEATLPAAFIRNGGKYDQITYAEFRSMICQNVNELEDRDWKGKRIAVAGESGCGWAISFFTILCKGGTAVLLDNKADPASANGLLARAECIAIMADNAFLSKTELNKCIDKIEFSNNYGDLCADISYETDAEFHKCLPETSAVIAFTSGTTGDSKFVQLTHRNLTRDIISVVDYFENFIGPNKIVLPAVPFYHLFGLSCGMLIPLYYGMTIGYTNGLKYLNDTLSTMRPHLIVTVPVILENMIRKFQIPNADSLNKKELLVKRFLGGNMEIIVSGGASLNEEIYSFFEDMGITVCNGYGMTECSPIITCNPIRKTKKGSVGKILNNEDKEIKLVDSEILIRGNIVMDGYLDNDTENKKVFSDGWFHTGDCGSIDSEGYLFITGRKKNLIILSDGNNVAPEELETLISSCELVTSVVVESKMNGRSEQLAAYIYPNQDFKERLSESQIEKEIRHFIKRINKKVPPYKRIAAIELLEKDFEKTALGKVKKIQEI